jgi:uncharacterized membrane protein
MTEYIERLVIETPDGEELQVDAKLPEHIEGTGHAGKKRSLVKTLTWRIIASTDTVIIATFLTKDPLIGFSIAGIEIVTKMILYYFHERGWASLDWGLEDEGVEVKRVEVRPVH